MNEPEPDLDAIAEERVVEAMKHVASNLRLPETRRRDKRPVGTHGGVLSDDARRTRAIKNARNRSRRGQATRPPGTQRSGSCRRSLRTAR